MVDLRPAAFLDRDGVVNIDRGYVGHARDFSLVEGAARAISLLNRRRYLVFIVTNQSGIGRGYFTEDDYRAVTAHMTSLLADQGANIDDIRYCPFHPEAELPDYRTVHSWRKPAPGMIVDLMSRWDVDRDSSFLIGNSPTDIQAARAAGLPGHLFKGGDLFRFLNRIKPELDRD